MTPAELDAVAARYERAWGIGRLPLLVSEQTAAKWQAALDMLAADFPPPGRTWEQLRESLARGWAALAAEATAREHEPLPGPVAEAEWDKGRVFAVALDDTHKQALVLRNKGRDRYSVWTVAEIATLIRSIPLVGAIGETFPDSSVLAPKPRPVGRLPQDAIPFGAWGAGEPPEGNEGADAPTLPDEDQKPLAAQSAGRKGHPSNGAAHA